MKLLLRVIEARLHGAEVQVEDLLLLGELLLHAVFDHVEIDGEQLRDHTHVDHVLDQLAQLGLRTDGSGDLVEGDRVADHIVAILLQVEALFVDGRAARVQFDHVLLGGFRIERHQNFGSRLRAT